MGSRSASISGQNRIVSKAEADREMELKKELEAKREEILQKFTALDQRSYVEESQNENKKMSYTK